VALAYFLGCDYTDGVTGVGIVNALEIVQAFPMRLRNTADDIPGGTTDPDADADADDVSHDPSVGVGGENSSLSTGHYPIVGLNKFKEWLEGYKFSATVAAKQKSISKSDQNKNLKKEKKLKQSRKRKKTKTKTKNDDGSESENSQCSDTNSEHSSESDADVDDNEDRKNHNQSNNHDSSNSNNRSKGHDNADIDKDTDEGKDEENGKVKGKGRGRYVAPLEALKGSQAVDSVNARRSPRKKGSNTETASIEINQTHEGDKCENKGDVECKDEGEGKKQKQKELEKKEKGSEGAVVATADSSNELTMNHNKVFAKKSTRMVSPFYPLTLTFTLPYLISLL
jgi:5'-3' exonuclease